MTRLHRWTICCIEWIDANWAIGRGPVGWSDQCHCPKCINNPNRRIGNWRRVDWCSTAGNGFPKLYSTIELLGCNRRTAAMEMVRSRSYDLTELSKVLLDCDRQELLSGDVSNEYRSVDGNEFIFSITLASSSKQYWEHSNFSPGKNHPFFCTY